jgi:hypothetical protein
MAKEQIIYLGPEEELTNVRERLENTNAGHIILVIPPQTQLRSHVGWRLLRSRVRELSQDVLIISSDRQIRAVAKAAGFRVADSLESPPSDRPRPINRPVRSNSGGRTSQETHKQAGSGNRASRSLRPEQQKMPPLPSSSNGSALNNSGDMGKRFDTAASSTYEIEDLPYDPRYDAPIETVPPSQFRTEDHEENEIDSWTEDYYVAQSIREAAQSPDSSEVSSSVIEDTTLSSGKRDLSSKIHQPSEIKDDPFAYMEDIQPVALPEQRASTFIHDIDQGVPDIADVPTDAHDVEVEDLGDGERDVLPDNWSPQTWDDQMLEKSDMHEASQIKDSPPRSNRSGNTIRPSLEELGNEDDLLPPSIPISDQPTRMTPSPPVRPSNASTPSTAARREPRPIIQPSPQARNVSMNPGVQQAKRPITTQSSRVVTNPPFNGQASAKSNGNRNRMLFIVSISLGILLLAFLLFLYFGSNATVTIVVPSQSLSATGQYVASTNQQNTIPSQVLTYTASARGQGTVTGTTEQGNQVATGTVTFTNKGANTVDIPTGTVFSSSGAAPVQFVTVADVLVQPDSSPNNIPSITLVQAKLPGVSGNVPANSITIIPPDSLTKIAQNSPGSNLKPGTLTVINPNPTTGGGASNVAAVTSNDAHALSLTLQQQVQKEINAWLAHAVHPGDVAGTLMPNVVASPVPISGENFVTTPAVGQPAPGGKFTGVLSVKVSLLVIRNAAIQSVGKVQLNAKALQMNPPSVLTSQLPVTVKVAKSTPSQDGTSLSVTVDATGHVVQRASAQQISQQLSGKSIDDARTYIKQGQTGITGVVDTNIAPFPPFLIFMPFRAEQIQIIVAPGPIIGTSNG